MQNKNRPIRKPMRLKGYIYNYPGRYFITICSQNREEIFGLVSYTESNISTSKNSLNITEENTPCIPKEMLQATVKLSLCGETVKKYIESGKRAYSNINISNYIIMPNHIHIIFEIIKSEPSSTPANATIPKFISALKRMVNKEIGFSVFQRSYHDHIIRTDKEYENIYNYVNSNPLCWDKDCLNSSSNINENMIIEMMNNYIVGLGNNM